MGPARPGRKIVYTGDTRPITEKLAGVAGDADLLIHDATYDETETARAAEFDHATAGQAGKAAAAAAAATLVLVHISSRYTDISNHIADAKKHFPGPVLVPDDLTLIEVPFRQ